MEGWRNGECMQVGPGVTRMVTSLPHTVNRSCPPGRRGGSSTYRLREESIEQMREGGHRPLPLLAREYLGSLPLPLLGGEVATTDVIVAFGGVGPTGKRGLIPLPLLGGESHSPLPLPLLHGEAAMLGMSPTL